MSAAPQPDLRPAVPTPDQPSLLAAWPRSAQNALCFVLGILFTIIVWNAYVTLRGPRPMELHFEPDPISSRSAVQRKPKSSVEPNRPVSLVEEEEPTSLKAFRLQNQVVDVNRATLEELQLLPGIGPKLAQRIYDERAKRPFANVEELRRVYGIGAKTLEKLRPYVTISVTPIRVVESD